MANYSDGSSSLRMLIMEICCQFHSGSFLTLRVTSYRHCEVWNPFVYTHLAGKTSHYLEIVFNATGTPEKKNSSMFRCKLSSAGQCICTATSQRHSQLALNFEGSREYTQIIGAPRKFCIWMQKCTTWMTSDTMEVIHKMKLN